ncbi:hypothetical protein FRB90_001311 [Tulasnella sp. 427]|nr:hypothetical protein FRB90_001311 [Tulasnella sp. 427]
MVDGGPPQLPWDILLYILQFVQPEDLPTTILVCKSFRDAAEPLLYRHIYLSNCSIRTLYVLRTLLMRRDLCKHVRTFVPSHYYDRPEGMIRKLKRILRRRKKYSTPHSGLLTLVVERLKDVQAISVPVFYQTSILQNLTKLHIAVWCSLGTLDDFLASVPLITVLELPITGSLTAVGPVQTLRAPFLEELQCEPQVAEQLVPGRPVNRVDLGWSEWGSEPPLTLELMEAIAQSTKSVTRIGLAMRQSDWEISRHAIAAIPTSFPDLEELNVWLHLLMGNMRLFNNLVDELSMTVALLPNLKVITLEKPTRTIDFSYLYGDVNVVSAPEAGNILSRWSSTCLNLEKVVFPNKEVWVKELTLLGSSNAANFSSNTVSLDDPQLVVTFSDCQWRCLNPFVPQISPVPMLNNRQFLQPEADWSSPLFARDLEKGWPKDLPAVIAVSKSLRKAAESLLYRHIDLANCPNRTLYLLRSLSSREDLCNQVRTFVPAHYYERPEGSITKLKSTIRTWALPNGHLPETYKVKTHGILLRKTPRLTARVAAKHHIPGASDYSAEFVWTRAPTVEPRSATARDSLQFIHVSELAQVISQSFATIKHLRLTLWWNGWELSIEILSAAVTALQELEQLSVWSFPLRVDGVLFTLLCERLTESMGRFPKLRSLDLSGSTERALDYLDPDTNIVPTSEAMNPIRNWSDASPSLQKVISPNKEIWVKESPQLANASHSSIESIQVQPSHDLSYPNSRWRCLNPFVQTGKPAQQAFNDCPTQARVDWSNEMFDRDLEKGWPKALPVAD